MASDVNADSRGGKVIFVSHCILNQNAKVRGIAVFPGAVRPVVDLLLDHGIGIYQMPCPEMTYLGALRWGQVRDQYDSPMFRRHCRALAKARSSRPRNTAAGATRCSGSSWWTAAPCAG